MTYASCHFPVKFVLVCAMLALASPGCNKQEQKPVVPPPSVARDVVAKTTVLATMGTEERAGKTSSESTQSPLVVFNDRGKGVAYGSRESGKLRIVHNGRVGRPVSAVDALVVSPDGQRVAYSAPIGDKWRMVIDHREGVPSDEVGEPVFSPDSRHIAYKAKIGAKWHMVVDNTTGPGCKGIDGEPVFSADSTRVAYAEQVDDNGTLRLVICDQGVMQLHVKEKSGALLLANGDKTRLAVIKSSGKKQSVIQFSFKQPDEVTEGPRYETISNLAFGSDGVSLSYVAEREGKRFLVLNGKEAPLPEGNLPAPPVVHPDGKGAGIIISAKSRYAFYQAFPGVGAKENDYDEASELVYSRDGNFHAYAARRDTGWFIVINGKEGPTYDRVVTPSFSPDGRHLVYRARKAGKRFVVVADANGAVLRQHRSYEMVFPPVFIADGMSVAYGVKDGRKLIWKVEKL